MIFSVVTCISILCSLFFNILLKKIKSNLNPSKSYARIHNFHQFIWQIIFISSQKTLEQRTYNGFEGTWWTSTLNHNYDLVALLLITYDCWIFLGSDTLGYLSMSSFSFSSTYSERMHRRKNEKNLMKTGIKSSFMDVILELITQEKWKGSDIICCLLQIQQRYMCVSKDFS